MANVIKAQALVLSYKVGNDYYPLACTKTANITMGREFLELAPKTDNQFKRYIPTKKSFTITGSGLVVITQSGTYQHVLSFFDDMFTTLNTQFTGYIEILDYLSNYKVYQFNCYITDLSLQSDVNSYAQYSYTLQGSGPFTEISSVDQETVVNGTVTARNPSSWKLIAVGYREKWYYNYGVINISGSYYIDMGAALNGRYITKVYVPV